MHWISSVSFEAANYSLIKDVYTISNGVNDDRQSSRIIFMKFENSHLEYIGESIEEWTK